MIVLTGRNATLAVLAQWLIVAQALTVINAEIVNVLAYNRLTHLKLRFSV